MPYLINGHKVCTKCGIYKSQDEYYKDKSSKDGLMLKCKMCVYEYQTSEQGKKARKRTVNNNKDKISYRQRRYRQSDAGKLSTKNSVAKRKENGKTNAYRRNKIKTDINYRLKNNLRLRIWKALNGVNKATHTKKLLGCSIEEFKKHITNQFLDGMDWFNYGTDWHIDHYVPCNYFDLSTSHDQHVCFNYRNMRPMWDKENIKKYDNVPDDAVDKIKEIINAIG